MSFSGQNTIFGFFFRPIGGVFTKLAVDHATTVPTTPSKFMPNRPNRLGGDSDYTDSYADSYTDSRIVNYNKMSLGLKFNKQANIWQRQ